jgi:NAD(P)-dependent dehydrogenase (short-subunit alcohol dehydrogenase family)
MAVLRRRRQAPWTGDLMPAQDGRTVVVTGGASGLGLELSRALSAGGAHVVMAVRNLDKGADAARRITATGVRGSVEVRLLDVSDLTSVREFATRLPSADVLINNAGVMAVPRATSVDGFELQLATNHLGHFALANLLLPRLTDRVVVVASAAHHSGVVDVDDLNMDRRGYGPYAAYAQSKLANLLFVAELQRRLTAAGSRLRATAGHPGYTSTGIQHGTDSRFFSTLSHIGNAVLGMKPSQGALPVLYAATMDIPGNSYLGPSGFRELIGSPALVGRTPAASDPELAKALWARSEELTGVHFPW